MRKTEYVRMSAITLTCTILLIAVVVQSQSASYSIPVPQITAPNELTTSPAPEGGTFYLIREDRRRCVSPLCGGYWLRRVNRASTRCANGRWMKECYVAEIDWNGQPEVEPAKALVRGNIVARRFAQFGNLGAFRATESWQSTTDKLSAGTFYRVKDRGVRCITHPCLSHQATKLNATMTENIAGVDLAASGANGELISEAAAAMTHADGIIVAGYRATVTGPAGRAKTLKATQFYLRVGGETADDVSGTKRCFKTGCSSQVCADHDVVTTCEFRPEYACYQKAVCERQADGDCGFTMTPELKSCLAQLKPGKPNGR